MISNFIATVNQHIQSGEYKLALEILNNILNKIPNNDIVIFHRAYCYEQLGLFEAAYKDYYKSYELNNNFVLSLKKLATLNIHKLRFNVAIDFLTKAIKIKPKNPDLHLELSMCYLIQNRLHEGWKEHEWRRQTLNFLKSSRNLDNIDKKPLTHISNINGKHIFVYKEQGLGDTLHFSRYLIKLKKLGGIVIFETQPELFRLIKNSFEIDKLITPNDSLPYFDYSIPLMSLPMLFQTTIENMSDDSLYLYAKKDKSIFNHKKNYIPKINNPCKNSHDLILSTDVSNEIKDFDKPPPNGMRLPRTSLRVGFTWSGNIQKTLNLIDFEKILGNKHIKWICLQKTATLLENKILEKYSNVIRPISPNDDFFDTAQHCHDLDLVISVDTSVAHLAAGMGKTVWLILPNLPDWRWMLDREDSPWYPTMRLFRQKVPGDWTEVIERVNNALESWGAETR